MLKKTEKRVFRHKRIRSKVSGTDKTPRLCVFRSNKHIYAQLINDGKGITLASTDDRDSKSKKGKVGAAEEVGKEIAKKALELKIEKVVFDRGGYKYHGRIKSIAESARAGGLKF